MRIATWALQVLLLAAAIFLFLRFVRVTRGSRLVRGLLVAFLIGVVGLWGVSKALELEELENIVQSVSGFLFVILAILFQPEIRRGIAQLGENSLVRRIIRRLGPDTVEEVVAAAAAMAERRTGAIIAFEREVSLDPYVEGGEKLDARVTRLLVEAVFHPGAPLHDGAIVVQNDRIAAAGCLFPLTEAEGIDRSTGTRHRAALGLTDETDAICVVVSEETGAISLAARGRMRYGLRPEELERRLRQELGADVGAPPRRSALAATAALLRRDAGWVAASIALAAGMIYVSHQDISEPREFPLRVVERRPGAAVRAADGELAVLLPEEEEGAWRLVPNGLLARVEVTGSRGQLDELGGALAGTLELRDPEPGERTLSLEDVRWRRTVPGLRFRWAGREAPRVELVRFTSTRLPLSPEHVPVDASRLDPRYTAWRERIQIAPSVVEIHGPADELAALGDGIALRLEPVRLGPEDRTERRERVGLAPELAERGFQLAGGPVRVTVPILPAVREIGFAEKEIVLVSLEPDGKEALASWRVPAHAQTARFSIHTAGLVPADAEPGSDELRERTTRIKRFVEENLVAFADVAELPAEGEGRAVPVRWAWRRAWRDALPALGIEPAAIGERESLEVRLESEPEILLEPTREGAAVPAASGLGTRTASNGERGDGR